MSLRAERSDEELLNALQHAAFDYFIGTVNPANGLVPDTSRQGSPCSIAVVGFALSCYPVGVSRGWMSRGDAAELTLTTLRFFASSSQGAEPDVTGFKGFYYHFLDMQTGLRVWQCELSLIDTTLLLAGILTAACYFTGDAEAEREIRQLADVLYHRVDWNWARDGEPTVSQGWHPFAAGDVCCDDRFTHVADATARLAVENALFVVRKRMSRLTIPHCTYTDPEIAHVGLHAHEANRLGIPIKTYTVLMHEVDRAITDSEEQGFVKIHVREGGDHILGATIVARHAGEMINEVTLAMQRGIGLRGLSNVIHCYPTQAGAIKMAADACVADQMTPFLHRLSRLWMRFQRRV